MKFMSSFAIGLLILANLAEASIVKFEGAPETYSGVKIYPEAKVQTPGKWVTLKLSGRGIRSKLGGFLKLYVISSYVEDTTTLRRAPTPMDGIRQQNVKALQLTMLTTLSAETIRSAFEQALAGIQGKIALAFAIAVALDATGFQDRPDFLREINFPRRGWRERLDLLRREPGLGQRSAGAEEGEPQFARVGFHGEFRLNQFVAFSIRLSFIFP